MMTKIIKWLILYFTSNIKTKIYFTTFYILLLFLQFNRINVKILPAVLRLSLSEPAAFAAKSVDMSAAAFISVFKAGFKCERLRLCSNPAVRWSFTYYCLTVSISTLTHRSTLTAAAD